MRWSFMFDHCLSFSKSNHELQVNFLSGANASITFQSWNFSKYVHRNDPSGTFTTYIFFWNIKCSFTFGIAKWKTVNGKEAPLMVPFVGGKKWLIDIIVTKDVSECKFSENPVCRSTMMEYTEVYNGSVKSVSVGCNLCFMTVVSCPSLGELVFSLARH
jgi:hypothetical protein